MGSKCTLAAIVSGVTLFQGVRQSPAFDHGIHPEYRIFATGAGVQMPLWPGMKGQFTTKPHIVESNAYGDISRPNHMQYSSCIPGAPLLAIADQLGYITILNTSKSLPSAPRARGRDRRTVGCARVFHQPAAVDQGAMRVI
jgi:hypothetical protein